MRIDKFLKNSRIIKRRTVAKDACDQGRILVNEKNAKAGTEVKVGDIIEIQFGEKSMKIEITELLEHVPKDKANDLYKVIN